MKLLGYPNNTTNVLREPTPYYTNRPLGELYNATNVL